jgi:hypothetical protein
MPEAQEPCRGGVGGSLEDGTAKVRSVRVWELCDDVGISLRRETDSKKRYATTQFRHSNVGMLSTRLLDQLAGSGD